MSDRHIELSVDSIDSYLDKSDVFYIHPGRISALQFVKEGQFASSIIKNTQIDVLTAMNLSHLLKTLKVGATVEVIIDQPITVMQEYDAKQVEANARLAGFDQIETTKFEYTDPKTDRQVSTLLVSFLRPIRNPNEVEVEVTIKKKTTTVEARLNRNETQKGKRK